MSKILLTLGTLFLFPSLTFAIPGSESIIEEYAGLLLYLAGITGAFLLAIGKIAWDKLSKNLEDKKAEIEKKEEKAHSAEVKLRDQDIIQIKERLNALEKDHRECNKSLPIQYVTKAEYDKYMAQHREDTQSMMSKFEVMMKEFKADIKEEMQINIERIITLISENKK